MKQSLSTTSARLHQLPAALLFLCAVTPTLGSSTFVEDLGNFPDATEIGAQFGTFNTTINGNPINATGFLFDLTNTSFGDGLHSSFENEPDGDFAQNDVLAATAAAAIDAAQPFGIFSFDAELPDGCGATTSAPAGFALDLNPLQPDGFPEINIEIDFPNLDGLLFDTAATGISSIFTNLRTGTIQFFVSTPNGFTLNDLKVFDGVPGLDIKTEMAWEQGSAVQTEFSFGDNPELRPRGELLAPVPVAVWLFGSGVRGQCRLETQEGLTLSALCSTDSGPL